jgi:methylmalonic acid semialdehyde dehydrogenase
MVKVLENYINGQFVKVKSKGTVDVECPATGKVLSKVPLSTKADLDEAVKHAQAAFPAWSGMTTKARAALMFKLHMLIQDNADELAGLIVEENGKNLTEALADVAKGNETAEWATGLPTVAPGRKLEVSRGINCEEHRRPLGIVGAIVPFNFPLMVPFWTIPISLTMGNCVILKPSEKVPNTMQRVCKLFEDAGFPPGVFQVVHGTGEVASALCEHPDISAISFVGSSKIAEIVKNTCNKNNKRVLALGGAKNHLIALEDCDTAMTARDVTVSFAGCAGQRCMAASVLIVVGDNQPLIDMVVANAGALQPGQEAGKVGPVIDQMSKDKILSYIGSAEKDDGAKILLDGRSWADKKEGTWVGPTILLHKSATDKAMTDEIFGPVLSIIQVETWEEAIAIENANPYGNAGCIYTEKGANAEWFTQRFRAAMLGVNVGIPVPREPFSFGGLYGTKSKYGDHDVTGDGAMEFFSNRIKVTSKWSSSYSSNKRKSDGEAEGAPANSKAHVDKANFDGKM